MYTRLTGRGRQLLRVRWTSLSQFRPAREVNATSPSIPAVVRPVLRCATCRTLTSVLDRLRNISFCRFRTFLKSPPASP